MLVTVRDTPEGQTVEMGEGFEKLPPQHRANLQLRLASAAAKLMGVSVPLEIRFIPAALAKRTHDGKAGEP